MVTPASNASVFTPAANSQVELLQGGDGRVLSQEALAFVAALARQFSDRRAQLLEDRKAVQKELDEGKLLDFLPQTKAIRDDKSWKVASIPDDLQDRRVEITGPPERKMIINALNSGAKVFMADFEDSLSPTWDAVVQGQINLMDAIRRTISYATPEKEYRLNEKTAVLIVRPRGWHLNEKHVKVDGKEIPAALFDSGLYLFHNAKELMSRGTGPYFYLPKLEHWKEAELWRDVFSFSEERLGLPKGTIKVTVLIETINAAFQMEEILHALKDYIVALNCGRWDYIYSFIKKFNAHEDFVLPDRAQLTMTAHFLRSYSLLLIKTCHARGAFAMGGMSAYIPVKTDKEANDRALAMVRADKEREAGDGHDGTWVAHPGLVPVAMDVFNTLMPGKNQVTRQRDDVHIVAADLLKVPPGDITEAGLRNNVSVSVQYLASWLAGNGCVPIFNLMEDAATAEIARSQIWQWVHHAAGVLDDGRKVTYELFKTLLQDELGKMRKAVGDRSFADGNYVKAATLLEDLVKPETYTEFLTLQGYRLL